MTRKNDSSPAAATAASARAWTAPQLRRLMTSAAAFSTSGSNDGEGFS